MSAHVARRFGFLAAAALVLGCEPARLYGGGAVPSLSDACLALLGPRAAVNTVLVVPVGRTCEAACLQEIWTLAEAVRGLPEEAVRLSVVFSRAGEAADEEQLCKHVESLPANVRGISDFRGVCLQGLEPFTRKALAPAKIIFDRDGDILALDYCAELPAERRAFEAIVMKTIRKIYRLDDASTGVAPVGAR